MPIMPPMESPQKWKRGMESESARERMSHARSGTA
jgi:hypothetical protein